MKCIKGSAKIVVGIHHKHLDTALNELKEALGNPQLIWKKLKEELLKKLGSYKDYQDVTTERLNGINRCLDFFRQAEDLAENYDELQSNIFADETVGFLRNILPKRYNQLFLDVSHKSLNPKQNIQKLTEFWKMTRIRR